MLGLDQDLEADLGIDSIKRVEILGSLAEAMGGADSQAASNLEMEKLTGIKTLRGIIDYLGNQLGEKAKKAAAPEPKTQAPSEARQLEVQRGLVQLVDAPLPFSPSVLLPSGTVLFTDDGRGLARELAGRLADFGQKTALIRMGPEPAGNGQADIYYADLTDPEEVDELLKRLRNQVGPLAGLVHLLPLAEPAAGEVWTDRMRREVKSLYLLAPGVGG